MKLVKPKFEIWEQGNDLASIYKHIEKCGRICYLSNDKITEDSAKPFVDRMIKSEHRSVLEHGTIYLKMPFYLVNKYEKNPYSITRSGDRGDVNSYITTNYRVLLENNWLNDLKYLCEPTEYHEKRVTVHFILPIGISREFCRHRVFSFSEQSTRYCDFSKSKFSKNLTFIIPCWMDIDECILDKSNIRDRDIIIDNEPFYWENPPYTGIDFLKGLANAEYSYLISSWEAQKKRDLLPLCTKTELVMTGTLEQWKHFFFLRCPVNAHPSARELAIPLSDEFVKRGYING